MLVSIPPPPQDTPLPIVFFLDWWTASVQSPVAWIKTSQVAPAPTRRRTAVVVASEDIAQELRGGEPTIALTQGDTVVGKGTMAPGKVIPVNSDDSFNNSDLEMVEAHSPRDQNKDEEESFFEKLRQHPIVVEAIEYIKSITYESIKAWTRDFVDNFAIHFSVSFDDVMMAMTLFVLFADSIKIIATPRSDLAGMSTTLGPQNIPHYPAYYTESSLTSFLPHPYLSSHSHRRGCYYYKFCLHVLLHS